MSVVSDKSSLTPRLYGVGIGPGASDLITLRARAVIKRVSVLAYPCPPDKPSLARRIVAPHARKHFFWRARVTELPIAMTLDVRRFPDHEVYARAARAIERHVLAGRSVAYLCEGDATLYGSFLYLLPHLRDVPVEIVPGVSAPMSGAALLQTPLAQGNQCFAVLPASASLPVLERALQACESVVFVKVGKHWRKVCTLLQKNNRMRDARYVAYATFSQQHCAPLSALAADASFRAPYFSMIFSPAATDKATSKKS